ncbi:MAG: response regulator [Bacteroides sp.]|nr:response regulator [Bacteroides sp.]
MEDNIELRNFIHNAFAGQFNVLEASDGEEGLRLAVENVPEMIITDLMMPVMDGLTMIKELRKNMNTSHIAVIMLTAKADPESEFMAIDEGRMLTLPNPSALVISRHRLIIH